jgi:hypothetical protein
MALCKTGHVYIVETVLTKPPKAKFALCICVDPNYFVWINTKPRVFGRDQLLIRAGAHPLVRHDSYLDLSRIVAHPAHELHEAREFQCISRWLRDEILQAVKSGLSVMPARHTHIIRENLAALYGD